MIWMQRSIRLPAFPRGLHLVTEQVVEALPELTGIKMGLLHLFIQHTSASLTINENADADVRRDLEMALSRIAPEDLPYAHTIEGPDDMPAHVKASVLDSSLLIPVRDGRLALGTWQGICLAEHRNRAASRTLLATIWGQA